MAFLKMLKGAEKGRMTQEGYKASGSQFYQSAVDSYGTEIKLM